MKRRDEVLVGILLTIATAVLVTGTLWLARGGLSSGYPLYARFPWGAGLKQGQPVLLAGVDVGIVSRVDLKRDGWLDATMRINDDYTVPLGTTATVVPVGIFGDAAIKLAPTLGVRESHEEGDTIPLGRPEPSIDNIIARMDTVGQSLSDVASAIELQLVQEGGIADLRQTLAATNRLMLKLNDIAEEQARSLSATTASLRRAASAIDSATVSETLAGLEESSRNLAMITNEMHGASTRLVSVLAKVDSGQGTAGQLVNDPMLYRDLRSLVTQLDSLATDFKKNPRKYINLEIF
ncbi:MAG: MlaD family protein [Gemmatimonadaceae bacterium]